MDPVVIVFLILGLAVVAFISGKVPLGLVSMGVVLLLWATGVSTLPEALSGFGDPTVIFIASLFVVSEALDATGVTAWIGQKVIGGTAGHPRRLTVLVALIVGVLAAFISINGAVAALMPVVVVVAVRSGIVPSRLLIPLAFAASAGSLLTLTGTPVNIIVSEAAAGAGGRAFGFFEFALVGLPILACTAAIVALGGSRLLPDRTPDHVAPIADPHDTAHTLRTSYDVPVDTGLIFTAEEGVAEVLIAPRSSFIGRTVSAGMMTRDETLVILAVRRGDAGGPNATQSTVAGSLTLQAGDAVVVRGPWEALERYTRSPDVIPVTSTRSLRRAVPLGRGARRALAVMAAMVVALATGLVPPAVAGLAAAGALVVLRVIDLPQAYRAISWTTVVLIAGLLPLSAAVVSSGAADLIAEVVLHLTGEASPHLALLVLCLVTVALGQFISNVATVLVVAPIALSVAATLDVSVMPFMMALTVAGAASFLTPIATPVNLMVMQPGGYRFGDYWRLGLPVTVVFLCFAVLYVPLIWHF